MLLMIFKGEVQGFPVELSDCYNDPIKINVVKVLLDTGICKQQGPRLAILDH